MSVPPMQCLKCNFKTEQNNQMSHHAKTCPKCPLCNFKIRRDDCLEKHIEQHSNPKTIKCEICNFLCSTTTTMIRHKKSHSNVRGYKCDECDKSYRQLESLKLHYKNIHNKVYRSKKR